MLVLVCLFIGATVTHAQTDPPPNIQPPPLLLTILLDDSSTMSGENSASVRGSSTSRPATDPNNRRSQAVGRLLARLCADSITHRVSLVSFASQTDALWLTPPDQYVEFGGGSGDCTLDGINTLLAGRRASLTGPGNIANALERVTPNLQSLLSGGSLSAYKPVILVITDDVPMPYPFNAGPWTGSLGSWRTYLGDLDNKLTTLRNLNAYNGACKRHSGVSLAVFGMGAANWINADGSLASGGGGNYYPDLLTRIESVASETGEPLYYSIDPGFASDTALVQDFRAAIDQFLDDVRCQWDISVAPATNVVIPMSALYTTLTLSADVPTGGQITLIAPNGNPFPFTPSRFSFDDIDTLMWTLERPPGALERWAGDWEMRLTPTDQTMRVEANAAVRFDDMRVVAQTETDGWEVNEDQPYTFQIRTGEHNLTDTTLITSVSVRVNLASGGGQSFPFELEAPTEEKSVPDTFTGILPAAALASTGSYTLTAELTFSERVGGGSLSLPLSSFSLGGSFSINVQSPRIGQTWACTDNNGELITVMLQGGEIDPTTLNTFSRAEVYYPPTGDIAAGAPTPTAAAVLTEGENDALVGRIDCGTLGENPARLILVRVIFPDGSTQDETLSFVFVPTATPLATQTPSPTAPPPTPTAAPPSTVEMIVNDVKVQAEQPATQIILLAVAGVMGLVGLNSVTRTYLRTLTPLYNAKLRVGDSGLNQPLLAWGRRYLPGLQSRLITTHDVPNADRRQRREPLFRIKPDRRGVRVIAYNEVVVNGQVGKANSDTLSTYENTTIRAGGTQFVVMRRK